MTTTATRLTLSDINRTHIAKATNTTLPWVSRIFSPNHPRFVGSLPKAAQIAAYLGISLDDFWTFLREECGKDI